MNFWFSFLPPNQTKILVLEPAVRSAKEEFRVGFGSQVIFACTKPVFDGYVLHLSWKVPWVGDGFHFCPAEESDKK